MVQLRSNEAEITSILSTLSQNVNGLRDTNAKQDSNVKALAEVEGNTGAVARERSRRTSEAINRIIETVETLNKAVHSGAEELTAIDNRIG